MHNWFLRSSLFDAEPAPAGGGSDTYKLDPGAPHELEPDTPEPPKPVKSAEAIELENLRKDNAELRKRTEEAEEDARYWARRRQEEGARPRREVQEEEPRRRTAAAVEEKPEKLIDELSTEGIAALRKRGIITQEELDEKLAEARKLNQQDTEAVRADAELTGRLARDFPEILEDSKRVTKGEKPQTELFKLTRAYYQEAVEEDPTLEGSTGAMLMAAKHAKRELAAMEKKKAGKETEEAPADDRQERRRARIEAQRPERGRSDEQGEGTPSMSAEQLEVMKRLNVKPEEYAKHREAGTRRGR